MSFVLPGNQRQLRFTGEAQAFTPKKDDPMGVNGAVALGKPRVRRNTQPPVPAPPPASVTPASPQATARGQRNTSPPPRINTPVPTNAYEPRISERDFDSSEEQATMALDRDGMGVMPGGASARPSARPSGPPVPNFRPANAAVATVLVPGQQQDTKKGAPLALWLFAAVLAGVLSYFVTPMAMSHFEGPAPKVTADMH